MKSSRKTQKSRDKSEIHKPKTERGKRSVPLPQALYDVLLLIRGEPEHYIVSSDGGKSHLTEFGFTRKWTDLMIACGFTAPSAKYQRRIDAAAKQGKEPPPPCSVRDYTLLVTPHAFRHNYITACVVAGIPPEVTMRIVGHANYQTTVNIYTHIQEHQIQASAVDLASVLEPGNSPNPNPFDQPRFGRVFRAAFRQLFFCIRLSEMKPNQGKSTILRIPGMINSFVAKYCLKTQKVRKHKGFPDFFAF